MLFSSIIFIFLFLPIFLGVYFLLKKEYRNFFILLASLLFYFWGEGRYVLVMIMYMISNYFFGLWIERRKLSTETSLLTAKTVLVLGLVFNIGFLLFFKYFNFIITNANFILEKISDFQFGNPEIHLPIGISFFTFQAVSYIIDIYRRDVQAQKNLINFSMYKALFPQLIAGPIVRYKDVSNQITDRTVTPSIFSDGIQRFIIGLAKKVLIANTVGSVADAVFALHPSELSFGVAWLGIVCYSIQIYFDFSGYSDMAIGLGKMMGFDFLENFNYPYISKSIREFWRRWHISLSSWFRDYLYIPLGGNRMGPVRNYFNLLFVFFLCGLWHGASWLFVIWGLWHGLFLILERTKVGTFLDNRHPVIQHLYMILIVMIGWVFFRAENLTHALELFKTMFGFGDLHIRYIWEFLNIKNIIAIILGIMFSTPLFETLTTNIKNNENLNKTFLPVIFKEGYNTALLALFVLCVIILSSSTYNPFIYFRF